MTIERAQILNPEILDNATLEQLAITPNNIGYEFEDGKIARVIIDII